VAAGRVCGESALVASEPLETWKDLLAYHVIEAYGAVLPKAFADEKLRFSGRRCRAPRSNARAGPGSGHGELVAR